MKKIKVLLIEDDEDYQFFVKELIKESYWDIDLETASSSKEGMEKLNEHRYDCVLVDYVIPGIPGIELVSKFREKGNRTPFVMMTSYGDEELKQELLKMGAFDYLSKNELNRETLQEKIGKAVFESKFQEAVYEKKLRPGKIGDHMVSPILGISPESSVESAIQKFNDHKIGSLLVEDAGTYKGIVTKRDIVKKVAGKMLDRKMTSVGQIMTSKILSMDHNTPVEEAVKFMKINRIQHLPVTREGRIEGMVTVKELSA